MARLGPLWRLMWHQAAPDQHPTYGVFFAFSPSLRQFNASQIARSLPLLVECLVLRDETTHCCDYFLFCRLRSTFRSACDRGLRFAGWSFPRWLELELSRKVEHVFVPELKLGR